MPRRDPPGFVVERLITARRGLCERHGAHTGHGACSVDAGLPCAFAVARR